MPQRWSGLCWQPSINPKASRWVSPFSLLAWWLSETHHHWVLCDGMFFIIFLSFSWIRLVIGGEQLQGFSIDPDRYKQTFLPILLLQRWINRMNPHTPNKHFLSFLGLLPSSVLLDKQAYLSKWGLELPRHRMWKRCRANHRLLCKVCFLSYIHVFRLCLRLC